MNVNRDPGDERLEEKVRERTTALEADIAERKRAEEVLAASERQFRGMFESPLVGILFWNAEGEISAANDKFLETVGYTRDDLESGKINWRAMTPPEYLGRDAELLKELAATGTMTPVEKEYFRKDGSRVPIIISAATIGGKKHTGVALIVDITERKRAEEAVRESEARYRTLVENIPQKIFMKDRNYRWVSVNENFARDLGIRPEEVVGKVDYDFFPKELSDKYRADDIRIMETGKTEEIEEKYLQEGKEAWVNTIKTPVRDKDGEIIGVFGIFWDITDRKRVEAEKERLVREVELKKVELEQLIFTASHDLRTPLVGVQGFVGELHLSLKDLLAELDQPDVPPALRKRITGLTHNDIPESLKFIDAGVTRMGALLSGMLRLSRLGRAAFRTETLDMNRIVGEVGRSLEFAVREAGAKVEVADLPTALSDPMQVGQVFANLIENALKYRSPDRDPVISITGRREGATAVYCVEDNGIGIEPEQQERIFTPFFRVDASVSGGEGLGLTIVTRIVERLGGSVWVESEPGKGSRFYVALPTG